ncbi:type IV pilus modification PilV family protein [Desulforhopalus sp. 52FAK]
MCNFRLPFLTDLRQTKTGFTLLEVMIAVSILSVALVALFGSQARSLSLATEAHFNNIAPMLASYKLAEIESQLIPLQSDEGDFEDDFSGYSWEIEVSDAALDSFEALDNIQNPLQQVLLTVSWEGTNYSYTLTYYAFKLQ